MAKVMLVEDDNNLREIYEARLLAEGYEIISAHDGEEALALAVREKPDLIISDVMMPKISGFDMLDILRGSPETKNTKVIMMTALSQIEDKDRADKLGADRYLVKSQVTLEDVVRVAKEVLEGPAAASLPEPSTLATPAPQPVATAPAAMPVATPPEPVAAAPVADMPVAAPPADPTPAPTPTVTDDSSTGDNTTTGPSQAADPVSVPEPAAETTTPPAETATPAESTEQASTPAVVTPEPTVEAPEPAPTEITPPTETAEQPAATSEPAAESSLEAAQKEVAQAQTADTEQGTVEKQIEDFVKSDIIPPAISVDENGNITQASGTEEAAPEPKDLHLPEPEIKMPAEPQPEASGAPEIEAPSAPATTETSADEESDQSGSNPSVNGKKVLHPINDPTAKPDLNALLEKEEEKERMSQILGTAGVSALPASQPATEPAAAPPAITTDHPGTPPVGVPDPKDPGAIAL